MLARLLGLKRRHTRILLGRLYALGRGVECPICGWQGWRFLPSGKPARANRFCPGCGSLERYRAVQLFIERHTGYGRRPLRMLELSPRGPLELRARSVAGVRYVTSDLGPGAAMRTDLTRAGLSSGAFDFIVVLHVLEHIPDDGAALRELGRLLAQDGMVLVMVPLRAGPTIEDPSASPQERRERFGQADHVRLYGEDIARRFERAGLDARRVDLVALLGPETVARHGLRGDDRYLYVLSRGARS